MSQKSVGNQDDIQAMAAAWPKPKPATVKQAPKERLLGAARGISGFHSYYGTGNTCGQAAIAAIADYWNLDIDGLPRDAQNHWVNATVVSRISADGYGPDVAGGKLGTSGGRLVDGLKHFGAQYAECGYAGIGGAGWEGCWSTLQSWVNTGYPVPVMISSSAIWSNVGSLEGHWPIVVSIDNNMVSLANATSNDQLCDLPVDVFLTAWNYLKGSVYGYNHCYVVASPQPQTA